MYLPGLQLHSKTPIKSDQVGRRIFLPCVGSQDNQVFPIGTCIGCSLPHCLDRLPEALFAGALAAWELGFLAPVTSVNPRGFSWSTLLDAMPPDHQQLVAPGPRPLWGNKKADLRGVLRSYSYGTRSPSTQAPEFRDFYDHHQRLLDRSARAVLLCCKIAIVPSGQHPSTASPNLDCPFQCYSRCPGSSALTSRRFFP